MPSKPISNHPQVHVFTPDINGSDGAPITVLAIRFNRDLFPEYLLRQCLFCLLAESLFAFWCIYPAEADFVLGVTRWQMLYIKPVISVAEMPEVMGLVECIRIKKAVNPQVMLVMSLLFLT